MNKLNTNQLQNRRSFLTRSIPVCALGCLGLPQVFSSTIDSDVMKKHVHKFNKKTGYTYEQAYLFRTRLYVDRMKRIAGYLGHDNMVEALKKSTEDFQSSIANYKPENTLKDFIRPFYKDEGYKTILTFEVIENSDDLVSWRVAECLNAKVFRELDAAEIGYATLCHGDEAWAKAFNPNIQFTRTKILNGASYFGYSLKCVNYVNLLRNNVMVPKIERYNFDNVLFCSSS